jgi:hypothetical protein
MSGKIFVNTIFISLIVFLVILILMFIKLISFTHFIPVLSGYFLGILSFGIGFLILKKMKDQSFNLFFGFLVGGILFRLIIMLSMAFISLYFLELNPLSFIFSFLFFYFFFLISELFYLKSAKI